MHQILKHSTILRNLRVSLIVEAGDQIHPFAVFQLGDDDLFAIIGCRGGSQISHSIPSMNHQVKAALNGYGSVS